MFGHSCDNESEANCSRIADEKAMKWRQSKPDKVQTYLLHLAYSTPTGEYADVLQDQVERMVRAGESRDALYEELKRLALALRREGREDLEDEVMDVMDVLVGWCAPSARL